MIPLQRNDKSGTRQRWRKLLATSEYFRSSTEKLHNVEDQSNIFYRQRFHLGFKNVFSTKIYDWWSVQKRPYGSTLGLRTKTECKRERWDKGEALVRKLISICSVVNLLNQVLDSWVRALDHHWCLVNDNPSVLLGSQRIFQDQSC